MVEFDFDAVIDRTASDSLKWGRYQGRDIIPAWVADMDCAVPTVVVAAIQQRLRHPIFGYDRPSGRIIDPVLAYLAHWHSWQVNASHLILLPGLVPALNWCCGMAGEPGDEILVPAPIYPPFLSAPANQQRVCVRLPHVLDSQRRWRMDLAAWESAVTPRSKALLFCHPHNPLGRNWDAEELQAVADFCIRHDLLLISDEIHCQFLLDESTSGFISPATLPGMAERTVTLIAPSKTYNIPGLACALAVIPDPELRRRFNAASAGCIPEINPFGQAAMAAAYANGEPWRQDMIRWLRRNRDLVAAAVRTWPGVEDCQIEATYLAWLDTRSLNLDNPHVAFETAGVGLHDGRIFGGDGFLRLNFATPRPTLERILERMGKAVAAAQAG